MAKGKGERKGGGGGAPEEEQEQKLQAILLADSFNTNFRPISSDTPKVGACWFGQHTLLHIKTGGLFRAPGRGRRHGSYILGIHVLLLLPVLMEVYVMMGMVRGTKQYGDDPLDMYDTRYQQVPGAHQPLFCSLCLLRVAWGAFGQRSKVKGSVARVPPSVAHLLGAGCWMLGTMTLRVWYGNKYEAFVIFLLAEVVLFPSAR